MRSRLWWIFLGFTLGIWAHDEFMQWAERGLEEEERRTAEQLAGEAV